MLTKDEISKLYDTILSIPGMDDIIKIDLKISRKNVFILNKIIERGLALKNDSNTPDLLHLVPEDTLQELNSLANECLKKAGLTEFNEKLKSFKQ